MKWHQRAEARTADLLADVARMRQEYGDLLDQLWDLFGDDPETLARLLLADDLPSVSPSETEGGTRGY